MDFSKAFDTVNHEILMSKLQHNGIRGTTLSLFKSYLSNRKQYVSIKNFSSSMSYITLGVKQSSVLGPPKHSCMSSPFPIAILNGTCSLRALILFSGDVPAIKTKLNKQTSSDQLRFVHFADDTTVYASDSDINGFHAPVNRELV